MPNSRSLTITVAEADSTQIRTEVMQGREYTVVPVVALVEGVLQGANSTMPEFAPALEFGKFPDSWNGRPVVLRHPRINGIFVSANIPQVLEDYHLGFMFNTKLENNKLKTEAWIDNARVAEVGGEFKDTVDKLVAGDTLDVSVGAYIETILSAGVYNGRNYQAIWANVVPDHLAILPDEVGACSVADGCGTNRVAAAFNQFAAYTQSHAGCGARALRHIATLTPTTTSGMSSTSTSCCDSCSKGSPCEMPQASTPQPSQQAASQPQQSQQSQQSQQPGEGTLQSEAPVTEIPAAKGEVPSQPTNPSTTDTNPNQLAIEALRAEQRNLVIRELIVHAVGEQVSFSDARTIVSDALPAFLGVEPYYVDVYLLTTEVVVFYAYGEPLLRGFHQIKYSVSNEGQCEFSGSPEPVNLMTRIMPRQTNSGVSANSGVGVSGILDPQGSQDVQDSSATQSNGGNMSGQSGGAQAPASAPATTTEAPGNGGEGSPAIQDNASQVTAAAANATGVTPATFSQLLETADPAMREMLQGGVAMYQQRQAQLVKAISAHTANRFSEAELQAKSLNELESLAALAGVAQDQAATPISFAGRAAPLGDGVLSIHSAAPVACQAPAPKDYLGQVSVAGNA